MKALQVGLSFCIASAAFAAETLSPTDIIRDGERQMRGESTQAVMKMVIKKPGLNRVLKLRAWALGEKNALVEILQPAKEEGISSLRVSDQMWNYLPKADQVVRVPTSLMLQSWMGSDFTNDDLMKRSSLVADYTHKILKTAATNRQNAILIECKPKPDAPVVWGKVLYWARASDRLPLKQMYYDERGKWIRTLHYSRFRKMDDRVVPTVARVEVAESRKQSTTIYYEKVLYDRVIDRALFNQDVLRSTVQTGRDLAAGWSLKKLAGAPAKAKRNTKAQQLKNQRTAG